MDANELLDQDILPKPRFTGWAWWQQRRGIYNGVLLLTILIVYFVTWDADLKRYLAYILLSTTITLLMANIFYSLPLVVEWISYRLSGGRNQLASWRTTLFALGIVLSVLIVLGCAMVIIVDVKRMLYTTQWRHQ